MGDSEYRQILEASDEAIITVNYQHEIILFNEGAERMFGYAVEEVRGGRIDILLPERFREIHAKHLERFAGEPRAARKMNERGQIQGRRKNGEEFPALASILKTTSPDGESHYTVMMRDISLIVAVADHLRSRVEALESENHELAERRDKNAGIELLLDRLLRESHSYTDKWK